MVVIVCNQPTLLKMTRGVIQYSIVKGLDQVQVDQVSGAETAGKYAWLFVVDVKARGIFLGGSQGGVSNPSRLQSIKSSASSLWRTSGWR
jgi:hypothetical protein